MLLYQGHSLVDNISEVLFVAYRKVRHSFRIARWCLREAVVVVVPPMQSGMLRMLPLISGTTGRVHVGSRLWIISESPFRFLRVGSKHC